MTYDSCDDAAFGPDEREPDPGARAVAVSSWRRGSVRVRPGVARQDAVRSRRAFQRFYREHFGLVWSMVRRFGVPAAQHEDAVQEVWIVAHRRLHTLEPDASARAWLSSIARRVASRLRRTDHRQRRKLAALEVAASHSPSRGTSSVDGQDAKRLLDDLLGELDDEQLHVLLLAQVHGLTGPEIAQALEIPLNTAYSRLRLARRRVDRFASELGTERAAVLTALRREEQPPRRAAMRAWVLLVPELGASLGTSGSGITALSGLLSGAKAFALVVGVGVLGLGVARAAVDGPVLPPIPVTSVLAGPADGLGRGASMRLEVHPAEDTTRDERPSPASSGMVSVSRITREPVVERPRSSVSARTRPPSRDSRPAPSEPQGVDVAPRGNDVDALDAENELLVGVQRALQGRDHAQALRLLDEHERRFPLGVLVDERRAARVRALCGLDRVDQARVEARRLLRDSPRSPVAAGVADVCS